MADRSLELRRAHEASILLDVNKGGLAWEGGEPAVATPESESSKIDDPQSMASSMILMCDCTSASPNSAVTIVPRSH